MLRYTIRQVIAQAPGTPERIDACAHCGQNHPFDLPDGLVEDALAGRVVIFAGAGISTESRVVSDATFADKIADELGVEQAPMTFPALMSAYQARFGRRQLLVRFRQRLDYIAGFPELWQLATKFHHSIATAYFLDNIVTTNWDSYFEDVSAADAVVVPEDYAFWDIDGRKVFKIHGSIHNLGTIVATEADYRACYRRLRGGTIGATLQHLLATKVAVFVGYSFGDSDLTRLFEFLRRELRDLLPRSYLVSPHAQPQRYFPPGRVIATDGTYFVHKLKEAAVGRGAMIPDENFSRLLDLAERLSTAHRLTGQLFFESRSPATLHALAYQDGMGHAVDRIIARIPSGHYSRPHATHNVINAYVLVERGAIRRRRYWDAAYARGYVNGLLAINATQEEVTNVPMYLLWGHRAGIVEYSDFAGAIDTAADLHRSAYAEASRLLSGVPMGVIPHHEPYLDAEGYMRSAGWTGEIVGPYDT